MSFILMIVNDCQYYDYDYFLWDDHSPQSVQVSDMVGVGADGDSGCHWIKNADCPDDSDDIGDGGDAHVIR